MVTEDQAKQLHDRSTRGESLSLEEQSLLEEWYAFENDSLKQEVARLHRLLQKTAQPAG